MPDEKLEVMVTGDKREVVDEAVSALQKLDVSAQQEMLKYMRAFKDGMNYAKSQLQTA